MAFRLHHYEALGRDKENLQIPLRGIFISLCVKKSKREQEKEI